MKGAWLYMSNIQMIQVLFALLMVFILLFFYLLYIGGKQIMARQEYSIYNIGRKRWSGSFYYKVYDFFVLGINVVFDGDFSNNNFNV